MQNFTQEMEFNSSTGQFKHKTIKKQRQPFNIEEVPNYPQENINTYLKRIPQKIPTHKHKYLQTYEDAFIDPYIYMGVLYNYSLRLLQNFKRHNLNKSQIIDRYTQMNKIDFSIPYDEKYTNIIYKIFKNELDHHLKMIKKEKLTLEDKKNDSSLREEFNTKIHDDIKELLDNETLFDAYVSKYNAFNKKYLADGVIQMLSKIYKPYKKFTTMQHIKKYLFDKNKNINLMYKPNVEQRGPMQRPNNYTRTYGRHSTSQRGPMQRPQNYTHTTGRHTTGRQSTRQPSQKIQHINKVIGTAI